MKFSLVFSFLYYVWNMTILIALVLLSSSQFFSSYFSPQKRYFWCLAFSDIINFMFNFNIIYISSKRRSIIKLQPPKMSYAKLLPVIWPPEWRQRPQPAICYMPRNGWWQILSVPPPPPPPPSMSTEVSPHSPAILCPAIYWNLIYVL